METRKLREQSRQRHASLYKNNLDIALRNYQSTPHSATQVSPVEALMKRKIKTRLLTLDINLLPAKVKDREIHLADARVKESYKTSFDKRHGTISLSTLEPEDANYAEEAQEYLEFSRSSY